MTASAVAGDTVAVRSGSSDLGPALGRLAEAALQAAAAKLSHKVEVWMLKLKGYTASAGPTDRAALEGVTAYLLGRNPVWAAMRGAWRGASAPLRLVAVLVLLLLLLLAPVVLLLLLLGLLVAAIVAGVKAAAR